LGGKGDSIPHSQWANHRCEDCGRIAGQVSPAGAARNHLATRGPASTDHSAAGSGGVGTASRTTSRAKFANGFDGRFLAAPSRSHVLPLADARPHASPPLRLHCLAVTYRSGMPRRSSDGSRFGLFRLARFGLTQRPRGRSNTVPDLSSSGTECASRRNVTAPSITEVNRGRNGRISRGTLCFCISPG